MSKVEYIDITPTWRGLLPLLVEVAANGTTYKGRKEAMAELYRLADIVDKLNAERKEVGLPRIEDRDNA